MSLSHQEVFFPLQAPAVLPLKSVVFHSYHNLFLRHGQLWHGSGAECGGRRLKEEMENAVNLKVNLDVDLNVGDSWYETK